MHQNEDASWHINIQGSTIHVVSKNSFEIILSNSEDNVERDFEHNRLVLHARTEEECQIWVRTLRDATNRRLENYYVTGTVIGEGGFARVHIGKSRRTGELCAIKTMKKLDEYSTLFGREIAILKRVDHPNIVKTYDVFETKDEIHIVMEYMKGGMLYNAIEEGKHFVEADTVQLMRELIDGILYLHRMGIVHRDVKPENVLCTSKNPPFHVKISDFGLSSICSISELRNNNILMSTVIGTPEFVAPEMARREAYSEKVDIWALGMLCYNLIAGQLPLDESKDMFPQIQSGLNLTFPEPQWKKYSLQSQSFVLSLLSTKPEIRLCALACLVHPWIEENFLCKSTKFAAHGRVSNFLYSNTDTPTKAEKLTPRKSVFELKSKEGKDFKFSWKMAFIAVSALNRLSSFTSVSKKDAKLNLPLLGESPKSFASSAGSTVEESSSFGSKMWHMISTVGDNTVLEQSLNVPNQMQSSQIESSNEKHAKNMVKSIPEESYPSDAQQSGSLKSHESKLVRAHEDGDYDKLGERRVQSVRGLSARRDKLRQKLKTAFSSAETPNSQSQRLPRGKLSLRRTKTKPEKVCIEDGQMDFDINLDGFGAVTVDDSDLVQLEEFEAAPKSLPADALKRGRTRELSKKAIRFLRGASLSPITPTNGNAFKPLSSGNSDG